MPVQPEFVIVDADFGSELYTGLLQSVSGVGPANAAARREDFEVAGTTHSMWKPLGCWKGW